MSARLKNVAVAGASGNLGSFIVDGLLSSGQFTVTILARKESSTPHSAYPSAARIVDVDYNSLESLTQALRGQDGVVSPTATGTWSAQKTLIDACIAAGVRRFIPSEFGVDVDVPRTASFPLATSKLVVQQYLREQGLSFTPVYVGLFLDWGIDVGFIIDPKQGKAEVWDDGSTVFSVNTRAAIAQGVVGVLLHPEETRNRAVRIAEADVSVNQLIAITQKLKPGLKYEITHKDSDVEEAKGWKAIEEKRVDGGVIYTFIKLAMMGKGAQNLFQPNDNELLGVKRVSEEELEQIVAKYVV